MGHKDCLSLTRSFTIPGSRCYLFGSRSNGSAVFACIQFFVVRCLIGRTELRCFLLCAIPSHHLCLCTRRSPVLPFSLLISGNPGPVSSIFEFASRRLHSCSVHSLGFSYAFSALVFCDKKWLGSLPLAIPIFFLPSLPLLPSAF